jgi:hypothetical protein
MTSAMLVGQGGDKKPEPPKAAPAAVVSSCSNDCGDCNNNRFGHRFRGLFHRDRGCDTCKPAPAPTTCHTQCERQPLFHSRCREACAPRAQFHQPRERCCEAPKCQAPKQTCAPACHDQCARRSCLDRLRERFQRNNNCCDNACTTVTTPGKAPEKIETPPKKLEKGAGEVRIENGPGPNVIRVSPGVPSVEITPAPTPAPRVDGARRDPF